MIDISLFTIADLHFSQSSNKPMDIFGKKWENHTKRLCDNWNSVVGQNDTVVIAGDISWGMRFADSASDLKLLDSLSGRKIVLKGNHDYWWSTMAKNFDYLHKINAVSIDFLFNNAYVVDNFIVCGTRGWYIDTAYTKDDMKIVDREVGRFLLSFNEAQQLQSRHPEKEIVGFLHYPPAYNGIICEKIASAIKTCRIKRVYFGHIHNAIPERVPGNVYGTKTILVAADYVNFTPVRID